MFEIIKDKIKQHKKLYNFLLKAMPKWLKKWIWIYKTRDTRLKLGTSKTHFFVLRRYGKVTGIASNMLVYLGELKYMEESYPGYLPVVEMEHFFVDDPDTFVEHPGGGTQPLENAWELFFLQPNKNRYGLEEVRQSADVILAYPSDIKYEYPKCKTFGQLREEGWDSLFRKYIKLRPELEKQFLEDWECLTAGHCKVLGVKARGSDYTLLKPKGHYIQPSVEQVIDKVKEFIEGKEYDAIFLSTEDPEIYLQFMSTFPGKVLSVGDNRIEHYSGGAIYTKENLGTHTRKEITMQYLEEMYLLARCDSLVTGITSSLVPTLLWNDGRYVVAYIFDLGTYD